MRELTPEQHIEVSLGRMIEQLKQIRRYEQNDRFMIKLFTKTQMKYQKAQRKFYKERNKKKNHKKNQKE